MGADNEIDDRRQRAREAFYDTPGCVADPDTALTEAIETATRVQVSPDVAEAYRVRLRELLGKQTPSDELVLRAAFEAAGFEVVE